MVSFESLMARRMDPKGEGRVIPLMLRGVDLPEWIRGLIPVDWTRPESRNREWKKLLRAIGATNVDSPPPEDTHLDLSHFADIYIDRVLEAQEPTGGWITSVTGTALVTLTEAGPSPRAYSAIQRGMGWLRQVQSPTGAWGRYRGRSLDDDLLQARAFDPDWPHTIYALWATLVTGSIDIVDTEMAVNWVRSRYSEETALHGQWAAVDILTLRQLAARQGSDLFADLVTEFEINKKLVQHATLEAPPPGPANMKSLYRLVLHTQDWTVGPVMRRAFAEELNRKYAPWRLPPHRMLLSRVTVDNKVLREDWEPVDVGAVNILTTALRATFLLDPSYRSQARRVIREIADSGLASRHSFSDVCILSTILELGPSRTDSTLFALPAGHVPTHGSGRHSKLKPPRRAAGNV